MSEVISIFSRKARSELPADKEKRDCQPSANAGGNRVRRLPTSGRGQDDGAEFIWYAICHDHDHDRGCLLEILLAYSPDRQPPLERLRELKVVIRSPWTIPWISKVAAFLSVTEAENEWQSWKIVRFVTEAGPAFRLKNLRQTTFSVILPGGKSLVATAEVLLNPSHS